MLTIDGSQGEAGGQVLRTAVGLSAAMPRPVRVVNIRAGRQQPGLRPQHLAAVRAAAATCNAELRGAELGSTDITFRPERPHAGRYRFDIGTAGSGPLVLQTVLPALVLAEGDSDVTISGGTHNPLAPCFEYFRDVFALLAGAANVQTYAELVRAGFYPTGGGEIRLQVRGMGSAEYVEGVSLVDRGELREIEGLSAASSSLPGHIVERQSSRAVERLEAAGLPTRVERATWQTFSPGTVVFLRAVFTKTVSGAFALGARAKPAERVADEAVDEMLAFLDSPGVVDTHAGDQLLPILALSPHPSRYVVQRSSEHLRTNAAVVRAMTGRQIDLDPRGDASAVVTIRKR